MITEDYCSYDVAELLKEKGFDEPCTELNKLCLKDDEKPVLKVTHQKAMKWLRKIHNIFIRIGYNRYYKEYSYDIFSMDIDNELAVSGYNFKTYKDAVDAALKKFLNI